MKTIGLIIDDDEAIRETLEDRLDSLGYDHHSCGSQLEAVERLRRCRYDFVLLDLELPVRFGKPSSIQVGSNLLDQIRADERNSGTKVLVVTAHGSDRPDLAVDLMKRGADDFINKPFIRLEAALRELLSPKTKVGGAKTATAKSVTMKPFAGGELLFHADGAELDGTLVCTASSTIYRVLEVLCEQRPDGRRRAFSGQAIADRINHARGQNAVAESVSDFRKKVVQVLEQIGIEADDEAVIIRGRGGYELADHIRTAKREASNSHPAKDKPTPEDRRNWFVAQLAKRKLKRTDFEKEFGISEATAKRDLRMMEDHVEFVGVGEKGYYRVKRRG